MLKSIFYARFHSERGPVVLRQYPHRTIYTPQRSTIQEIEDDGQVNFSNISSYIIPPYELCNRALSVTAQEYRILGWPVSIEDQKYPRNRFTFNICFVIEANIDHKIVEAWTRLVEKTARWFRSIEDEDGLLSAVNESNEIAQSINIEPDMVSKVLVNVFQQLNEHGECCVAISERHVLNLRLSVTGPRTVAEVHAWDVPLIVAELPDRESTAWNLALEQIHAHIDGVNHVYRIAERADVELELVIATVTRLVASQQIMLLDIFHFQAMYALTSDMTWFAKDEDMQLECKRYITRDGSSRPQPNENIVQLYLALRPGLTLAEFCSSHQEQLYDIDVRRLITFGIIKGFLRRIQRYAKLVDSTAVNSVTSMKNPYDDAVKNFEKAWKQAALSSGWATPPSHIPAFERAKEKTAEDVKREQENKLRQFLDGKHCFDEICVEMGMSERKITEVLDSGRLGKVIIFAK